MSSAMIPCERYPVVNMDTISHRKIRSISRLYNFTVIKWQTVNHLNVSVRLSDLCVSVDPLGGPDSGPYRKFHCHSKWACAAHDNQVMWFLWWWLVRWITTADFSWKTRNSALSSHRFLWCGCIREKCYTSNLNLPREADPLFPWEELLYDCLTAEDFPYTCHRISCPLLTSLWRGITRSVPEMVWHHA